MRVLHENGLLVPSNSETQLLRLLHIDDSDVDRLLVKEAISRTQTPLLYYEADCLEEAVRYFEPDEQRSGEYPRPSVVLLDYDLGRQTGVDFLYWLRQLRRIKTLPVVMFSGCSEKERVAQCYQNGADYFVCKPSSLTSLSIIVQTLHLSLVPYRRRPCPIVSLLEYRADPRVTQPGAGARPGAEKRRLGGSPGA